MSESKPIVPDPEKGTVDSLSSVWWARPTFWTTVGGIFGNLAAGATGLVAVFSTSPKVQVTLGVIAGCFLVGGNTLVAIGNTLARNAAFRAAAAVSDRSDEKLEQAKDSLR